MNEIKTPLVILGAGGMLAQDLAEAFSDYEPELLGRPQLDITDRESVKLVLGEIQPGTVINAAAYNNVDGAEEPEGEQLAMAINAQAPKVLAEVCANLGATFVQYTSDYVFENNSLEGFEDGFTEDLEPLPGSVYSRSKREGELAVLESFGENYIVRTCRLFGKAGESPDSKQSFVDMMLSLAEKLDELKVVDEEVASPTYTKDLAEQTRRMLETGNPGIYHITNEGMCTWYEFAKEIFRIKNNPIPIQPVPASEFPRAATRPAFSALKNTKLPKMRNWQEALADYLNS